MSNRDSIIEKIRKLARLTIENGATEHEAARASELISRLVSEYNITQDDLALKADASGCLKDSFVDMSANLPEWGVCIGAISRLFSTRSYYSIENDTEFGLGKFCEVFFFGFPVDVAASLAMISLVANAVNAETILWRKKHKGSSKDFRDGMSSRLKERILELLPVPTTQSEKSGALVVLKQQLVTEEWAKQGINLRPATARVVNRDAKAFSQGREAGSRVTLEYGAKAPFSSKQGLLT